MNGQNRREKRIIQELETKMIRPKIENTVINSRRENASSTNNTIEELEKIAANLKIPSNIILERFEYTPIELSTTLSQIEPGQPSDIRP